MSALNREDFMTRLKERIGEDTSDEAMSFIEDFTDTFNDFEERLSNKSDTDWEQKYNDLDQSWREKYKARFFEGTTPKEVFKEQTEDVKKDSEELSYEDLFEEREG